MARTLPPRSGPHPSSAPPGARPRAHRYSSGHLLVGDGVSEVGREEQERRSRGQARSCPRAPSRPVPHAPLTPGARFVPTAPALQSSQSMPAPALAAIKPRQQATWASGDYAVVGTTLTLVGESL